MSEEVKSENKIKRSASSRTRTRKPKRSQIPIGIAVLLIVIAIGVLLTIKSVNLGIFWFIGIIFGFILQRSRFCFTAALRDPSLTGGTSLTKAVLLAFAITSIGFTAIKYGAFIKGLPIPGQGFIAPVSFGTVIGAFMFGIGMVIAGGCASGTLMRVGEGFTMLMITLLFFIVGSLLGAYNYGWWKLNVILKGEPIFLPDIFGWAGAIILQLLFIGVLYLAADKWEKRKNNIK